MPESQTKRIDVGDLTEVVTSAVSRAIEAQKPPGYWPGNHHIIIGIIIGDPWPPRPIDSPLSKAK